MRTERKLSVYESIMENIKRDIELGIIAEGERLPSCREMAMRLGINPNTVQRAYSELEAQGVIYTVPKKGVYAGGVTPLSGILNTEELEQPNLTSSFKSSINELKKAGISRDKIIEIIDEVYKDD